MATIPYPCVEFHRECNAEIGQSCFDSLLRWSLSCHCPLCGTSTEFDETGIPPVEIGTKLLHENGTWKLYLQTEEVAKAALALKNVLQLSPADALALAKKNNSPVYSGTAVEVEWLKHSLAGQGVMGRVVSPR